MNNKHLIVVLLALAIPLSAHAETLNETLYATAGAGQGTPSTLYILDATDGSVVNEVGAIGFNSVVGIAFHPMTGVLYGVASDGSNEIDTCGFNSGSLITIDPITGEGTFVGCIDHWVPDVSFDSNGVLYGWGEFSEEGEYDDLVTIDLATGMGTRVGESGTDTARTGLAFDSEDSLFLKPGGNDCELHRVDPVNGSTTPLVQLSKCTNNIAAFDKNDVLFTGTRSRDSGFTLQTIDIETGLVTDIGSNSIGRIAGLAFQPPILTCSGFMPPFDKPLSLERKTKRAIPVDMVLTDAVGQTVTDLDITASPVINVLFSPQIFG